MIKFSFIKDSLLYTIGNALPMAASIILLPFYANYLSAENYVALSFYIGISLLFQIIFSFSFEQYYGVIYSEIKHDNQKVKLLNGSIFIYLSIYGSVIILLSLLFGNAILHNIFDEKISVEFFPYGLLSILTAFFNALFKVSMSTYIYTQQSKIFFYSNLLNFFATILISLSGLFIFPYTLTGPIYGRFLSGIIILFFNLWILKNNIVWKTEKAFIKEFVQKSWALFAYTITIWIIGNMDRYFLKNYIRVNELASYDLIMKCFIGIEFIQNGLSMAIISKIFDRWKVNNQVSFDTLTNRYFNVFIISIITIISIFTLILPHFIQLIISNNMYYLLFNLIGIISIGYIIRTISYPYYFAFLFSKKTNTFFIINAVTVLLQIILSYLFIQRYGLLAAIYIMIFTRIFTIVFYHLYIIKKFSDIHINPYKWFFMPLILSILYFISYLIFPENYNISNFIISVFLLFTTLFIYKNELKQFIKLKFK